MPATAESRRTFSASLPLDSLVVEVEDCEALDANELDAITAVFNTWGLVVIQHPEPDGDPADQVVALGLHLGSTYDHNRADERGIVRMAPLQTSGAYLGATNRVHPLHTDGAYDATPPPLLALQCVVAASTGGESVAVSSQGLVDHIAAVDPDAYRALAQPAAMTVERADQRDTKPVVGDVDGTPLVVWRDDHTSTYAEDADTVRAVALVREYLSDPANVLRFLLQPNQIMLLDNWAILHGRTAFEEGDERLLHRINYLADSGFARDRLVLGVERPASA